MGVVVLVGVPGAGKTTVGELLAKALDVSFNDSDHLVEQITGKSVSDIFIQDGESAFRKIEEEQIAQALTAGEGVLALGGGALGSTKTLANIKGQNVVWLIAGLSTAVERVGMNRNRPLLLGNVRGQLSSLLNAREPLYRSAANISVDTTDMSPEDVCQAILSQLP